MWPNISAACPYQTKKPIAIWLTLFRNNPKPFARYFMTIVLNDTQDVIGNVGITRENDTIGNIGWFLRQRFWGRGYATEATLLMIRYGFEIIGLKKLVGSCHRENKASERVMEKCKFYLTDEKAHLIYYALNHAN